MCKNAGHVSLRSNTHTHTLTHTHTHTHTHTYGMQLPITVDRYRAHRVS